MTERALVERAPVEPAYLFIPPRAGSAVRQVAAVCASVGRILDAEQLVAVDALTSVKADGTPAALEGAIISARQNLKTFILEGIALTKLIEPDRPGVQPMRLGIWSAHLFDTAQESFRNFDELLAGWSHLSKRVKKISRGNGEEEIEFIGGRRLKFKARSKSGGRGLTGDFVILDEAFALQPGHMGALLPTLSTRRRAHVLYGSSAGQDGSEVLRGIRDRGRAGGPGAPAYVEFCAPETACADGVSCRHVAGTPGCALDREDLWLCANPALGRRISVEHLRAERLALAPPEFARERLGWWDQPGTAYRPIPLDLWARRCDPGSVIAGAITIGIDIPPDRRSASVAVAGRRADGRAHLELARTEGGVDWVVKQVVKMLAEQEVYNIVVGESLRPAIVGDKLALGPLMPAFLAEDVTPVLSGPGEMAQGCGRLQDAAEAGTFRHIGQDPLTAAMEAAVKRDLGDGGWLWGKRASAVTGGNISGLVAITEAHRALTEVIDAGAWGFFE